MQCLKLKIKKRLNQLCPTHLKQDIRVVKKKTPEIVLQQSQVNAQVNAPQDNLKLPKFWKHNAEGWIALIEAKFRLSRIDAQVNRYVAVLETFDASNLERLFGKTLRLPSSFFTRSKANVSKVDDQLLLQNLLKFFDHHSAVPINSHKNYRRVTVDEKLFETPSVYVRVDRVKKGLKSSYTGQHKVQQRFDKYFTVRTSRGPKNVSLDRLKPAYEVDIMQNNQVNLKDSNNSVIAYSNCSTRSASTELKSKHESSTEITTTSPESSAPNVQSPIKSAGNYATRSGRVVRSPLRFDY